jgi:Protein of unknown function (DUF2997)
VTDLEAGFLAKLLLLTILGNPERSLQMVRRETNWPPTAVRQNCVVGDLEAMDEKIIITVNTDGTTKIEAEGFEGSSCDGATAPYEEALGRNTQQQRNTQRGN